MEIPLPDEARLVAARCLQGGFSLHFCAPSFWMLEKRVQEANGFHKPASSLMQQLDQWLSGTSAKATPKVGQRSVQQKDSCLP